MKGNVSLNACTKATLAASVATAERRIVALSLFDLLVSFGDCEAGAMMEVGRSPGSLLMPCIAGIKCSFVQPCTPPSTACKKLLPASLEETNF